LPGSLPKRDFNFHYSRPRKGSPRIVLAYAAAVGLIAAGLVYYSYDIRRSTLATGIGEQRTITLEDGTRVELNTSSELRVRYDEHTRKVILKAGEAYFDVAQQLQRPFIVAAGKQQVVALGTAFMVRRDYDSITVTLLDGRVAVTPSNSNTDLQNDSFAKV